MTAKTICEILESQVLQFIIVLVLQFSNPDFWRKKKTVLCLMVQLIGTN